MKIHEVTDEYARLPDGWPFWPISSVWGEEAFIYPDESPPELTSSGDYILYHGTTLDRARSITKNGFARDDIGAIGFGTKPDAVKIFATMRNQKDHSHKRRTVVLKVIVDQEWIKNIDVDREGNHKNLWLFRERIKGPTVLPLSSIKDLKVYRSGYI